MRINNYIQLYILKYIYMNTYAYVCILLQRGVNEHILEHRQKSLLYSGIFFVLLYIYVYM